MTDDTLDRLFRVDADGGAATSCRPSDGVTKAGKETRARIERVFSKQGRITARLRELHVAPQSTSTVLQNRT